MDTGKVLALDYGKKRVGVATGDLDLKVAFPRMVVENRGEDYLINRISELVTDLGVKIIVLGLPLNMDREDETNEMTDEVRYFASRLRESFPDLKIELFDERLSSFEAGELKGSLNMTAEKNILGKDAYAAQIILQRFFDKL